MKKEIFEKRGKLYVQTSQIEILKRKLDGAYERADKTALELVLLENKYIGRYKMPNFSK